MLRDCEMFILPSCTNLTPLSTTRTLNCLLLFVFVFKIKIIVGTSKRDTTEKFNRQKKSTWTISTLCQHPSRS